jgi:hypothetical protein
LISVLFYRQYKKYEAEAEKEDMIEKFLNPWRLAASNIFQVTESVAYLFMPVIQTNHYIDPGRGRSKPASSKNR